MDLSKDIKSTEKVDTIEKHDMGGSKPSSLGDLMHAIGSSSSASGSSCLLTLKKENPTWEGFLPNHAELKKMKSSMSSLLETGKDLQVEVMSKPEAIQVECKELAPILRVVEDFLEKVRGMLLKGASTKDGDDQLDVVFKDTVDTVAAGQGHVDGMRMLYTRIRGKVA